MTYIHFSSRVNNIGLSYMNRPYVEKINQDVIVTTKFTNENSTHPYKTLIFARDTDGMYTVTAYEFDGKFNNDEGPDHETSKIVGSIRVNNKQKVDSVSKMSIYYKKPFIDLWEEIIKSS